MSAPSLRENNFDLLRLLAAAQVVAFHGAAHLRVPLDHGHPVISFLEDLPGVPIFFVISGFLISASYERNSDLGNYLRNRALRIFPALWVCLAVSVATAAIVGGVSFWRPEVVPWLLAQVSFGQFYNPAFLREYGVGVLNGSLWTIPVEIQFYVAVPLLYAVLRRLEGRANAVLIAIAAASWASQRAWNALGGAASEALPMELLGVSLAPYLWMFLLGVLIQRNLSRLAPLVVGRAPWWLLAYAALALAGPWLGGVDPKDPSAARMVVLAFLTVSFAFTTPQAGERLLRGNDVSYGVYIYHMVFVNAFVERGATGAWSHLGAVAALTLAAATLSWFSVERPALRRKRRALHYPATPISTR